MAQEQTALETKGKEVAVSTEPGENLFERLREATQTIARRAFELFEERGRKFGHDFEDWLRAESEFTDLVPLEIKDSGEELVVRAKTPGFKADELKVLAEPKRLTISGRKEEESERKDEDTILAEWHSRSIFRAFDLPCEVKTEELTATLKEGILSLTLPKAEVIEPAEVKIKTD